MIKDHYFVRRSERNEVRYGKLNEVLWSESYRSDLQFTMIIYRLEMV